MEVTHIDLGGVSGAGGAALRLDSDGLIDLQWAHSVQASQTFDFCHGVRNDSAVPLARDLNYVLQHVREKYRPLKYARVLPTDPVPDWAERWEVSKITGTGSVQLASQIGREDIVTSDFSRDTTTGRMFEVVNGYKYWTRELIRAAVLGINPQVQRAMIQAQAAEEFLDALCATGLVGSQYGSGGARDLGLGLTGLGNNADILGLGLVTASTKASTTTSWTTAVAADFALVLDDLHNLISAVYVNSKENHNADTIVMPLDEYNALNRLRPSAYAANIITTFLEEWQKRVERPVRFEVWDRFASIGTISSGPRVVAFDASDKDVVARITGKEYGVDQVREVTRGFEANASLVTGGVRVLDASGAVYMDLAA
ncbi:MAG TPA: major capsid family protein [Gaiellaceae bacterium]